MDIYQRRSRTSTIRWYILLAMLMALISIEDEQHIAHAQSFSIISPHWGTVNRTGGYDSVHKAINFGLSYQPGIAAPLAVWESDDVPKVTGAYEAPVTFWTCRFPFP